VFSFCCARIGVRIRGDAYRQRGVEFRMPQSCRTCEHPKRSAIDIELARGINCMAVSRRFDVPPSSVRRHKRSGHVPASIISAFPRHRADLPAEAMAQLRADEAAGVLLHLAQQRSTLLRMPGPGRARRRPADDGADRAGVAPQH
jgi:hypothetical protein